MFLSYVEFSVSVSPAKHKKKKKKKIGVKEKKTNFTLTTEVFAENRTHTQGDKNP